MSARAWAALIAAGVFVADRASKLIVQRHIPEWDTIRVVPGLFNIIHTENPGAAFSVLADAHSGWRTALLILLSCTALILVAVLLWRNTDQSRLMRAGLALILGGAFGNVYDRILYGAVTDFLELYYRGFRWPAFNVADSAITIGAGLVLLDMLRHRRAPQTT